MVPLFVQQAVVGLGGGLVYASWKLRDDLCASEVAPTHRQIWAALFQFANFLVAAPLFAGAFTAWVTSKMGQWATWPMVAVFIGLSANLLWPLLLKGINQKSVDWVSGIWTAIRGGAPK